jgi:5-carboxymethyl-2-hydroxymuconic-semialdehyde dehydrogenase
MDRVIPNASDVFQANRDRAAPLLKQLRADGIGHMIDGKIVPSISGETFETNSPIDGAVLASVARGNAEDIDRAATAAALAFKAWRDMPAALRKKLLHRVADAIEDRADDIAVLECIDSGQAHRFMAKAAISRPARRPASTFSRRCPPISTRSLRAASSRCRSTCRSTTRKPAGSATISTTF